MTLRTFSVVGGEHSRFVDFNTASSNMILRRLRCGAPRRSRIAQAQRAMFPKRTASSRKTSDRSWLDARSTDLPKARQLTGKCLRITPYSCQVRATTIPSSAVSSSRPIPCVWVYR